MENTEAKLSVGSCTVRGVPSGEIREKHLITQWTMDEFDKKISDSKTAQEKGKILKEKAKAVAHIYYEHLAAIIKEHNFPLNGTGLPEYLAGLSDDDVKNIEEASNLASSLTNEEVRDLSQPSGVENPPSSRAI